MTGSGPLPSVLMPGQLTLAAVVSNVVAHCRTQKLKLFSNIFAMSSSLRTRAVCIKILEKFKGVLGDRGS